MGEKARKKLLLVEDNAADAELLVEMLEAQSVGCEVTVVESARAALEFLDQPSDGLPSDIIILDLNLPRMSGLDLLAHIKNDPRLCRIPTVIMSSSVSPRDVAKSYELHASAYMRKPVDLAGVRAVAQAIRSFWIDLVVSPPPT